MIAILLAEGFEEVEALTPCDVLRRAGCEVRLAGLGSKQVAGSHGITVVCDVAAAELDPQDLEMLILPGGKAGTDRLAESELVSRLMDGVLERGNYLAAICAAPSVPGRRGLLEGKTATCYPGFEQYLKGARYTGEPVEQDGTIITARGMGVSLEFGLKLAEVLKGSGTAEEIRRGVQCR